MNSPITWVNLVGQHWLQVPPVLLSPPPLQGVELDVLFGTGFPEHT